MYMYIVALIRIPLTIIFSRKHLKCQTWLPQGRKWPGEISSRSWESQGISLQVSGNFMVMNHHNGHEIEQQTDGGFSKKSVLFARYCLGATLYQFTYTACVWLKA